ncbi:hypothetical protein F5Y00DRAFT_75769 [Daldinia vernicosa]|uniref:uncharacterized protein n=1 Tax=Daldinia vernicosa TaxID=114800 RepID=UPI0020072D29|nr:uncharacterized protein F5Y00DRAFT_75769 [Daldinia vernicosa]KAI0848865.1 hypothetical protein F5Y00DRAFT_75769 [Daldinia vernicosa]
MANDSIAALRGGCPAPFFNELMFPADGGRKSRIDLITECVSNRSIDVDGRICAPFATLSCCVPCPMTDWAYPDNFTTATTAANWVNVVGMVCCAFLLISWIVLPVDKTHRHYLSISLACAVVLMNVG